MLPRFASFSAVASLVIALAAGSLRLNPFPNLETRYLLTSLWCMLPLAWGLWAMLTPRSWLPQSLPLWGAILGLIAAERYQARLSACKYSTVQYYRSAGMTLGHHPVRFWQQPTL